MSDNSAESGKVDAATLLNVLQQKLRTKDDENSLLQARVVILEKQLDELRHQLPEPEAPKTSKPETAAKEEK